MALYHFELHEDKTKQFVLIYVCLTVNRPFFFVNIPSSQKTK